ncbi:small secreted protein [Seiridium cupressi]
MRTSNITSWGLMASMAHSAWALNFNVTAVTAHNGSSVFECWQIDTPFVESTQPGIKGSATLNLGGVTNITYGVLPAGYTEPLHTAPAPQWGLLLSGLISINLPEGNNSHAFFSGGEFGLMRLRVLEGSQAMSSGQALLEFTEIERRSDVNEGSISSTGCRAEEAGSRATHRQLGKVQPSKEEL